MGLNLRVGPNPPLDDRRSPVGKSGKRDVHVEMTV